MQIKTLTLLFCSLMIAGLCLALPTDSKQVLHINADTTTYNFKTGDKIFVGNVKVDQGTTHIRADKLITKNNQQHVISEVIATSDLGLAHYWTITKNGQPETHAYAKVIKFYPLQSNVTLEKSAKVLQGENSFQGELIHYNSNDQTVTVPRSTTAQAVIVYNPES